jgi:hypothetical protein
MRATLSFAAQGAILRERARFYEWDGPPLTEDRIAGRDSRRACPKLPDGVGADGTRSERKPSGR